MDFGREDTPRKRGLGFGEHYFDVKIRSHEELVQGEPLQAQKPQA